MTTQNSTPTHNAVDIPLASAAGEAARACGQVPPPGAYRRLQGLVQDGQLEVIRRGSRIFVPRAALPAIAAALGMNEPTNRVAA